MSALWAADPDSRPIAAPTSRGARLRAVDRPPARLSRAPFLLVLIGVFGLGMAGLLMLNTTLQNQAFSSRALNRQATELAYTQAALENQIDVLSAPPELARRASALGMRPNPYPAFLELPSGKVIGDPRPVNGSEVPSMVVKTPAEVAAEKVAAKAKAEAKAKAAQEKAERAAAAAKKKAQAKKAAEKKTAEKKAAEKKAAEARKPADERTAEKKPTQDQEGQD